MDAQILAARPGLLHEHVGGNVADLADDVELAQAVEASAPVRDGIELVPVLGKDLANGMQPVIVGSSRVDLQACKLEYSIVSPK